MTQAELSPDDALRSGLASLVRGGDAARPTTDIMREFPFDKGGVVLDGLPYSAWSLVEHLRIAQADIVMFSQGPGHESPKWPEGYWPDTHEPPSEKHWTGAIERFEAGLDDMVRLIEDSDRDLLAPFPWGDGQTMLREAVMLAEHNAYHGGQLVVVGRLLGVW